MFIQLKITTLNIRVEVMTNDNSNQLVRRFRNPHNTYTNRYLKQGFGVGIFYPNPIPETNFKYFWVRLRVCLLMEAYFMPDCLLHYEKIVKFLAESFAQWLQHHCILQFHLYSLLYFFQSVTSGRRSSTLAIAAAMRLLTQWMLHWWQVSGSTARWAFSCTHPSTPSTRLDTGQGASTAF